MPGNAFIKFVTPDGKIVPGESLQTGHPGTAGWVEIGDWSWDIEAETSFTKGTGASVGKPTPGTLSFSHYYDKSSPTLMKYIVQGTHFKTAQIDMLKQTGKSTGEPEIYFQMFAKDVFISKVSSKGGEDGTVNQDIEMVFKEVNFGYRRQKNDGSLDKTVPFGWNIAQMDFNTSGDIKLSI
jgi:type VI secretion system secreted protein Hcp